MYILSLFFFQFYFCIISNDSGAGFVFTMCVSVWVIMEKYGSCNTYAT